MDNYFLNCPPMMSDGRQPGTDYKMATRRNEYIKYINDVWRDDQYRLFLQLNGKEILDKEWDYLRGNYSCWMNDCVHKYPTRTTPRHMWEEREIYDSIYKLNGTNRKYAPLRTCYSYKDFRLNPKK